MVPNLPRRKFLQLVGCTAANSTMSRVSQAEIYPARPVRLIVGFSAGGVVDTLARLIGQSLSERLGQPFVIENRVGAGGNIGTEAVVRAPPDGHTMLMINMPHAINPALYDKLNFNFVRDIAPAASIMRAPGLMVVNPSVPAKTVLEFIAYVKANPGAINMASAGRGTTGHVFGELFKFMTGLNMVHVPYRGGAPAIVDLLSGQVHVYFGPILESIEHVRVGKLWPLAVTTAERVETLADIPSLAEFVPGYEASGWHGVGAPVNTPREIVEKLNSEINAALSDPQMRARLIDLGGTVLRATSAEFSQLIAGETEKWARVIKFAGLKPE
jgi:tripartite-type tricarboxylate transporter receptor subunit TctC